MSAKIRPFISLLSLALALFLLFGLSCASRSQAIAPDPGIVEAHSPASIGRRDPIRVVFSSPMWENSGEADMAGLIRFEPGLKGEVRWLDERILEFKPATALAVGRAYRAIVDYGILLGEKAGTERFTFDFKAQEPGFSLKLDPVSLDSQGEVELSGSVITADDEDPAAVERLLSLSPAAPGTGFEWKHQGAQHRFSISGLKQGDSDRLMSLRWKGRAIDSGLSGSTSLVLPGSRSFKLLGVKSSDPSEKFIELAFSRALDRDQDLRGIVSISGLEDLRYAIDRNKLRLYPAVYSLPAEAEIHVEEGLRDFQGQRLAIPVNATAQASQELPQLRFVGSGVIVPGSQAYTLPIETMNLRGLIVEAFKINAASIPQFLQVNELDGNRELKRVGQAVWSKAFDLSFSPAQRDSWVRHGLDLSELIKKHPDGMFQIRLAFRKRHIDYTCSKDHPDFSHLIFPGDEIEDKDSDDESSYWDYWEGSNDYSWDSPYNYYNNRNDPCHPAFYSAAYGAERVARRNVLISNIGLSAKLEDDGVLSVYAADLRQPKPLEGVSLSLLNYQRQVLSRAKTNKEGIASFPADLVGSDLLTAEFQGQLGYLKLDEKSALKTSHFDVDGECAERGIKGFIYGERGVWRPGDSIFLTFILQDPAKVLPADHPVLFELENPRGQVVNRASYTSGLNGFYAIETRTASDAPTGDYLARVRVGGKTYTKLLKVETVMPNRLKINLDFGTATYLSPEPSSISLSSAWLHGAPAPGLKADMSAAFVSSSTSFPGYSDYVFDDPTRSVSFERLTVFEGVLDKDSKLSFKSRFYAGTDLPGKLKVNLLSRVYEPSGVFSSEQVSMDFHPYERYVGIKPPKGDAARGMLLTDTDHSLDIVVLDREGKPVPSAQIECSLAKIQWRWWWEKGAENLAEYQNAEYYKKLLSGTAQVRAGKGSWTFNLKYPEWGRYILTARDKQGGHSTAKIVYIDWPGWAGRGEKDSGSAAMLSLSVPKPSYVVGEKVQISFPSNDSGSALLVLEKGGRILKREWVKTAKESTKYEFTATGDMAPNVYVHVSFLQAHLQTANDLPIRLYGVVPVMVEDPQTRLKPLIQTPSQLKPLSEAAFSVKESSGRPMTYTVAVVDEGLLGLTRFKVPDPWGNFFKKEASLLKAWDLYPFVSGAYSGKLETLLAIGGSDDGLAGANRKANRFKPVAAYLGPFSLGAGETKNHKLFIPEYVGALRFMVVAAAPGQGTSGPAYGSAEIEVPVKSDLMVIGTLPRVLSPGEEISFPVSVFCYLPGKNQVRVSILAEGGASLTGPASQMIDFSDPGDKLASFKLKAADKPGLVKLRIMANSGPAATIQSIEFDVRSTGIPVSDHQAAFLDAKTKQALLEFKTLPGIAGTNSLSLELSRLPPLNLASRLDWLIAYPHGCVEQTTSAVFPQLYLERALSLDREKREKISKNVSAGIERLKSFQTVEGGFAYWPGSEDPNAWGSNYAGHFLLEARRAGYAVPQTLLGDWLAFQKRRAQAFSGQDQEQLSIQAYRLYTLALAKEADMASMNRLRERSELPLNVAWRLAAAYYLAGERRAATDMVKGLSYKPSAYRELSGTYGSEIRDMAMILETLNIMEDSVQAGALARTLAEKVGSKVWMSTQELSYSLIALLPFLSSGPRQSIAYSYQLGLGKGDLEKAVSGSFDSGILQIALSPGDATSARLMLSSDSSQSFYARLIAQGIPAMGEEKAMASGCALSLDYADLSGKRIDPDDLALGSDMQISLTVRNSSALDLREMALTHLLPSGWEILNYRLAMQEGEYGEESEPEPVAASAYPFMDYQDIRDDRVMTYFSLARGDSKTFIIRVNKTYEGRFYLPAVSVSAMYDQSIQALVPGRWLSVSSRSAAEMERQQKRLEKLKIE